MIEDALFLVLGFCTATLIALACIPLLWSRALRLTRQRLEMLVPLSTQEVEAERDGLRAKAAVAQRRLEQGVERSQTEAANLKLELGRRTVSLVSAERAIDELRTERATFIAELAHTGRDLRDQQGQSSALEKALYDADRAIETASMEAREQEHSYAQLAGLAEGRRAAIAALETLVEGLLARLEDGDERIGRLTSAVTELTALQGIASDERASLETTLKSVTQDRETIEQALAKAGKRATELERRLRRRSDALASARKRMLEQTMTIEDDKRALTALQERFDALQAKLTTLGDDGAQSDAVARLRDAIVSLGDDTLHLLTPHPDRGTDTTPEQGPELVRGQNP